MLNRNEIRRSSRLRSNGAVALLGTITLLSLTLPIGVGHAQRASKKPAATTTSRSRSAIELAALERLSYVALDPNMDGCWRLGGSDIALILPFNPAGQPLCEWNIDELRFAFLPPDAFPEVDLVKDPREFDARASAFSTPSCFGTGGAIRFGEIRTFASTYEEFLRSHSGPLSIRTGLPEFMSLLRQAQKPYRSAVDSIYSRLWHTPRLMQVTESNYDFGRQALVFRVFDLPTHELTSAAGLVPKNWRIAEGGYPTPMSDLTAPDLYIREIVIPMSPARADSFITGRRRLDLRWYFSISGLEVACASLTNPDGTGGGNVIVFYPKPRIVAVEITTEGEAVVFGGTVPSGQYAATRLGFAVADEIVQRVAAGDSLGTRRPYTQEDLKESQRRYEALQAGRPWAPPAAADLAQAKTSDDKAAEPSPPEATLAAPADSQPAEGAVPMVAVLETTQGKIVIRLADKEAPRTAANFRKLVREKFYDGTCFHRVIGGFMIQGGDPNSKDADPSNDGLGGPGYTVPAEIKLMHVRGAVATARQGDQANPTRASSGSQFFIDLAPQPALDAGGYTVFGQVISGMDAVDKIAAFASDASLPAGGGGGRNPGKKAQIVKTYLEPLSKWANATEAKTKNK